jgi:hypothetical protein
MEPTNWGCPPTAYHQYPQRSFNPWVSYPAAPADYFKPGWIMSRPMFGLDVFEKRARFKYEARSHHAIVIQGSRSPIRNANEKYYTSDRKLAWVRARPDGSKVDCTIVSKPVARPNKSNLDHGVKPGDIKTSDVGTGVHHQQHMSDLLQKNASYAENGVTRDGLMHGCLKNIAAKSTNLHDDLRLSMETRSEKPVVPIRPSTNKPADVSVNQYLRGCKNFEAGGTSKQRKILSVRDKIFTPKATVCKYRPRNLGDSRIKSVGPRTKPRPQWCPTGLTHTQKRRVQRLRASEIKEYITLKKRGELFRRDTPMVPPNMTWRKKLITTEESKKCG